MIALRHFTFLVLLAIILPGVALADVQLRASVQPSVVTVGEEAVLEIVVEGKFRKTSSPELPKVDGLSFYQAGTSQRMNIVNGRRTSSIQFTYVIAANNPGIYKIEPIRFQADNKIYTAEPVTLEVVKASQRAPIQSDEGDASPGSAPDQPIFIRAHVDQDTVYVNQQISWTLGFYTDGRVDLVRSPEYSPPTAEGFWAEDLPPQKNYHKIIGGKKYLVNEIKRGFFAAAPGHYNIGSARVEVFTSDGGRWSFDDFFGRRGSSFGFGRPTTLTSDQVPVTVLPLPTAGRPAGFSGLVGSDLSLSLKADKQVAQVGEPVNVTLEVAGNGNFKTMASPKLGDLPGFKIYESGSSSDLLKKDYVVSGRKKADYVLIPKIEGDLEVPAITISYFDPVAREYKLVQSSAITMQVMPSTQEEGRQVVYAGAGENIEVLGRDINYIRPVPASVTTSRERIYNNPIYVALHTIPLLAFVLSIVAERRRRRFADNTSLARASRAAKEADKKIGSARRLWKANDYDGAVAMTAGAMRSYFADKMNVSPSGLTIEKLQEFLVCIGASEDDLSAVQSFFNACDGIQYSPEAARGDRTAEVIDRASALIKQAEAGYSK